MLSLVNQYIVALDACVLLPMPMADTLLRLAEEPAFYLPRWSEETIREIHRNLQKWGYTPAQADRRVQTMNAMFEDAQVTGYEPLLGSMKNDPKDRHVLAAAVRSGAHAIVTDNTKDFPPETVEPSESRS
jgi:predicted nucleic acid-binding protein